jgi:hypothetical protein
VFTAHACPVHRDDGDASGRPVANFSPVRQPGTRRYEGHWRRAMKKSGKKAAFALGVAAALAYIAAA